MREFLRNYILRYIPEQGPNEEVTIHSMLYFAFVFIAPKQNAT